jgi:urease accessory protein
VLQNIADFRYDVPGAAKNRQDAQERGGRLRASHGRIDDMIRVETIVGSRSDPEIAHRLHHLGHHGAVDTVQVEPPDLDRHRLRLRSAAGVEVAIALPRGQKLFDGAVLVLDDDRAIVVRAGEQRWIRATPATSADALQLGYHAGNLHWKVRFEGSDLLIAADRPTDEYVDRLEPMISDGRVTIEEPSG